MKTFKLRLLLHYVYRSVLIFLNRYNKDILPPCSNIYFLITYRCNADCKFCNFARSVQRDRTNEATEEEIVTMLASLKRSARFFHINISGGEPLLRSACLLTTARYAAAHEIMLGFTTNGALLDETFCSEAMEKNLFFNINVSVDYPDDTHCKARDLNITFERLTDNLKMLSEMKKKFNARTKLIVKTIVSSKNLAYLSQMVEFTRRIGFNHINFQPIFSWTGESDQMKKNIPHDTLKTAFDALIDCKKKYPNVILNEARHFTLFHRYFAEELKTSRDIACPIGLSNLYIRPNLDVSFGCFDIIGNAKETDISALWKSKKAQEIRELTRHCQKTCLTTCQINRSFFEKMVYAYKIMFSQ